MFFDAGNLRPRAEQIGLSQERYGIGPGIRYNLPIGALRLDYGINPGPAPTREDAERFSSRSG